MWADKVQFQTCGTAKVAARGAIHNENSALPTPGLFITVPASRAWGRTMLCDCARSSAGSEHQTTNLGVGGSNPPGRAKISIPRIARRHSRVIEPRLERTWLDDRGLPGFRFGVRGARNQNPDLNKTTPGLGVHRDSLFNE